MAQRTLSDGTTGDVVIRSGPPASGGGYGGGLGGGGNRVGASGNFGGPSAKTKALRRRALQEHREKQARDKAQAEALAQQALELARSQTRQQLLERMVQRRVAYKVKADHNFSARSEQLLQALESEISAARKRPDFGEGDGPWQLYLINKSKNEIDQLRVRKSAQLNDSNNIARSYDGHDPFTRTAADYLARLEQFGDALESGRQIWESAYNAAHEARLLSAQIDALSDRYNALSREHAEWVEKLAEWDRRRQYAEQREARVRFKQQADADTRLERIKQANTLQIPVPQSMSAATALAIPGGAWAAGAADALAVAVSEAVVLLAEVAGTLSVGQVAIFIAGIGYPSELGNGELTSEQRARLFHAVAVPAHRLELYDSNELQDLADAGGSVEVSHRLKPIALNQGTAIAVTPTGGQVGSQVPVLNASLDPKTGAYIAEIPGYPSRNVQFQPDTAPQTQMPGQTTSLAVTQPQLQNVSAGADWRFQDCVVCVPGLEPVYLSFGTPPLGSGVVTGTGQPATRTWWEAATQPTGAAIPSQIGEQLRGRDFKSFDALDNAFWETLGEAPLLLTSFDEVNRKRIERGYAPYAPKNTWVGEHREFDLRYEKRPEIWFDPFNLDLISLRPPNSAEGWVGIEPTVESWPIPPASSWKPLVPPGSEHLGSTTSPTTPVDPLVYPGNPAIPILPPDETFPAVDEQEIGASIPGFPGDMELPSPDVLFHNRRNDPGVATGAGQAISGLWLGEAARGVGAPIPSQIADQLRLQEFKSFDGFRRAFWKAVAADPELSSRFTPIDLYLMKRGKAPYADEDDWNGGRNKYEIHHLEEVVKGGAVYDMDNLVIMTPSRHIDFHKGRD